KSAVDSLTTTLDDETAQIQDTANGVSSITDLPSAISKISTSLSSLSTAFSQTLQTIDNADASGELQSAIQDAPECSSLASGAGRAASSRGDSARAGRREEVVDVLDHDRPLPNRRGDSLHRARAHVADGVDARHVRRVVVPGRHESALVALDHLR